MSKCIAKLLLCFGLVLVMPGCGREGSPADDFEEASASSWTVTLRFLSDDVARDFDFIATSPLWPSLVIPVRSSGGGNPEVRSWRAAPTGKNLYVLEYLAGLVGTYERVFEIRSAVVDLQSGKVIVDGASASLAFPNNEPSGWQPGWTWTEDELVIETGRGPRIIRLTMRLESNEWQVRGLDKSRYCSRGLTADGACL